LTISHSKAAHKSHINITREKVMLTKEHFLKAADLIEEKGLAKSVFYDLRRDCLCTVGALAVATGQRILFDKVEDIANWLREEESQEYFRTFYHEISKEIKRAPSYDNIYAWNDSSEQAEVVAKLREFAETIPDESTSKGGTAAEP
jgi:hypothetical protein